MTTRQAEAKWRELNSLDSEDEEWETKVPARFKKKCTKDTQELLHPAETRWYD